MNQTGIVNFNMYTEIVFGAGAEKKAAEMIKKHGGKKVMLVYGEGSVKKSGLYDTLTGLLDGAGIPFVELGGVKPNPLRSTAMRGLEYAKREGVDFLLAAGGGSVIDTAKAIALGLAYDGDFWDFYLKKAVPERSAKVGAINTISAAGSETSGSSVIVDDVGGTFKKSVMYPGVVRPVFALENPELTYSVSKYQTAAGASDIIAHSFDRYFLADSCRLADEFASGLIRTVMKYAPAALCKPDDYEARSELMLAGSFSHNDFTGVGKRGYVFSVHGLESYLSAAYDTSHGAGLALLMPAWLEYIARNGGAERTRHAAQFARDVFGTRTGDDMAAALEGARMLREWFASIGMPVKLSDLGIPESDIPEIVKNTRSDERGILPGYLDLDKKAVKEIFDSTV